MQFGDDFVDTANKRFQESKTFWNNWRAEARDDFAFISGNQWLDADRAYLEEQKRPPITFNYSEKMVDAVVGAEVSNRQRVQYAPRSVEDAPLAELWTNAAIWVRDECNAEDEETDAFRDALICGMGWTRTKVSYDEDLDGKIEVTRIDPLEMYADPAASKLGLIDRRFHFHIWWVNKSDAKREWPDSVAFAESGESDVARGTIRRGHRYEGDAEDDVERHKDQVQIRLYEGFELEPVYRVADPSGIHEIDEKTFQKYKKQFDAVGIQYLKQMKKTYFRAYFAGDTKLEAGLSPCQKGFTFQCITAKRDRNKNTWYGITRVMKDPQRWANKWLSQILHIINSNAKGGLMAEIGAFVDPKKAQDEWSSPDSITLLREGGINKVEQKQMPAFPSGLDRLMEFALSSLPMVTGINLEALGLANREQAGVLEAQRKQAAYGLLSPLFDALRRYRKNQGRILLDFIHNFISDGRLVRIGGPESQQFLPLTKQPDAPEYDIIIEQAPNAPDVKEKTWETLVQILPAMMKAGYPVPPDLLDYTPLPTALSVKWKQYVAKQGQPNPQMQQLQQQVQQLAQENQTLKQDQSIKQQQLQLAVQETQAKLALQKQKQDFVITMAKAKADEQFRMDQLQQERLYFLERQSVEHNMAIQQHTK